MKKLLTLLLTLLLSMSLFGHSREKFMDPEDRFINAYLKYSGITCLPEIVVIAYRNPQDTIKQKSDYQKYWEEKNGKLDEFNDRFPKKHPMEYDDLYFSAKDRDQEKPKREKPDTLRNRPERDDVFEYAGYTTNYYRFYSPVYSWRFYDPWYDPFFYNDFYYDPFFYNDFYFGINYGWNWNFGWGYPYYNNYYWHNWYDPHYTYNIHNDIHAPISRRSTYSTMTQTRRIEQPRPKEYAPVDRRTSPRPNERPMYGESRKNYQPSYSNPRMPIKPSFNNSREQRGNMGSNSQRPQNQFQQRRVESSPMNRNNINQNQNRTQQQSRTYTVPNRSSNYSAPSQNRSSNYSGNSGVRSSGSSSGFSGNSGVRSSGGSSSGSSSGGATRSSGTGTRR